MRPKHPKLLVSLIFGGIAAFTALIVYLSTHTTTELTQIAIEFANTLFCAGIALIAVVLFTGITVWIDQCTALTEEVSRNTNDTSDDDINTPYLYFRRFKEVREYSGKTVDGIARMVGCHRSTIYRNESERSRSLPNMRYLFNFCNSLEASADYILYGEFLALPWDIAPIMYGFTYGQQIVLLEQFISIARNL